MYASSLYGNREIPGVTGCYPRSARSGKAKGRAPDMYASGKSDGGIISMRRMNKGAQSRQRRDQPLAEFVERRPPAEGNRVQTAVTGTQGLEAASIGLSRVREAAKRDKDLRFTNLLHHIDIERLHAAYLSLNRRAAAGVDEETWQEYGEDLDERLITLHDQIHSGRYRASASKRVWIPKPDG
jgi:RNA-directed DNA polymerase